jgi:hypothetical protein
MAFIVLLIRPDGLVAHQRLLRNSPAICTPVRHPIAHELPPMRHLATGRLPALLPGHRRRRALIAGKKPGNLPPP